MLTALSRRFISMQYRQVSITDNAWTRLEYIYINSSHKTPFLFSTEKNEHNGYKYKLAQLSFQELIHHNNSWLQPNTLKNNNISVIIDPNSEFYLTGTIIDYKSENIKQCIYDTKFIFNSDEDMNLPYTRDKLNNFRKIFFTFI